LRGKESAIKGLKEELERKIPSFEREIAELNRDLVRKEKEKAE